MQQQASAPHPALVHIPRNHECVWRDEYQRIKDQRDRQTEQLTMLGGENQRLRQLLGMAKVSA